MDDAKPGPGEAAHALLAWKRDAILALAEDWGGIDRSHRKLAHRGSRLDRVHVSESTVLRVLEAAGMRLHGAAAREKQPARPWPDWAELVPGVIWIYDFTHFTAAKRCAVANLGMLTTVSRQDASEDDRAPAGDLQHDRLGLVLTEAAGVVAGAPFGVSAGVDRVTQDRRAGRVAEEAVQHCLIPFHAAAGGSGVAVDVVA